MNVDSDGQVNWYRVGGVDLLDEGRVTTVQAGHRAVCLTRTPAGYGAISNRCPHQGGPLGDGFLQNRMVGHSNLGLADAFYKAEKAGRLRYFGIRHEGAAAFAASGYAKLTGRPAACFSIAGPGATNLLTGLWDAKVDRVPILALTGQVNTQVLGPGAFQEVPLAEAFAAVVTWSQTVLRAGNATELRVQSLISNPYS